MPITQHVYFFQKQIFSSGVSHETDYTDYDIDCSEQSSQSPIQELELKYTGFGINWADFFKNILDIPYISDVTFCKLTLSLELQHLIKITPESTIRQFIIIHTILYSDLSMLIKPAAGQPARKSRQEGWTSSSQESQCLNILLRFLPSLEDAPFCDDVRIRQSRAHASSTISNVGASLYALLAHSLNVPVSHAAAVTNSSVRPVMAELDDQLVSRCERRGPQGQFDEYDFNSNMVKIIQFHHSQYLQGQARSSGDSELMALWISSSTRGSSGVIIAPSLIFIFQAKLSITAKILFFLGIT